MYLVKKTKLKKAEGEINFFFIMISLILYIVILLMIMAIGGNNSELEKVCREISYRVSVKASVSEKIGKTDEWVKGIFEDVRDDMKTDIDYISNTFLGKRLKVDILDNLILKKIILTDLGIKEKELNTENGIINDYYVYILETSSSSVINMIFFKYKPVSYSYIFIRVK